MLIINKLWKDKKNSAATLIALHIIHVFCLFKSIQSVY